MHLDLFSTILSIPFCVTSCFSLSLFFGVFCLDFNLFAETKFPHGSHGFSRCVSRLCVRDIYIYIYEGKNKVDNKPGFL